jgi:hypothetical protein
MSVSCQIEIIFLMLYVRTYCIFVPVSTLFLSYLRVHTSALLSSAGAHHISFCFLVYPQRGCRNDLPPMMLFLLFCTTKNIISYNYTYYYVNSYKLLKYNYVKNDDII